MHYPHELAVQFLVTQPHFACFENTKNNTISCLFYIFSEAEP